MEVMRTRNTALILETLTDPKLWSLINEDGVSPEGFEPDVDHTIWIAMLDDDERLRGFVAGIPLGKNEVDLHVAIKPEFWGEAKVNVALGKKAVAAIQKITGARKFTAQIPVIDKQVVRYAQRVGLQREGVNKKSYLRNGELHDQYHMGLIVE